MSVWDEPWEQRGKLGSLGQEAVTAGMTRVDQPGRTRDWSKLASEQGFFFSFFFFLVPSLPLGKIGEEIPRSLFSLTEHAIGRYPGYF